VIAMIINYELFMTVSSIQSARWLLKVAENILWPQFFSPRNTREFSFFKR
jgi:hypothetical protein